MPSPLSFDQNPDRFSHEAASLAEQPLSRFQGILKEEPELFIKYFAPHLWGRDLEICRLHYLKGLTQDQVANLLGTTQPAIHSLLQSITIRLRFGIRRHQLAGIKKGWVEVNIIIRDELEALMPPDLNLAAFFYCVEVQQNRVSKLTRVSPATAHRQLGRILVFLDKASSNSGDKRDLARKYKPFFEMIRDEGHKMTAVTKANDGKRKDALVRGRSIFDDDAKNLSEEDWI